jgi:isopenicillin N synthase-like dioxygenase
MQGHTAQAQEARLKREAEAWAPPTDAASIPYASEAEIPVLDLEAYFAALSAGSADTVQAEESKLAERLRHSAEHVGFFVITGHGLTQHTIDGAMRATTEFHALPLEPKLEVAMDAPDAPTGGVGYLPVSNRKLPARDKPNQNAAYIVKRELGPRGIQLEAMPWPCSHPTHGFDGSAFRASLVSYCDALEALALRMLPLYSRALEIQSEQLLAAFRSPLYRLRASHYPPTPQGDLGIQPHVDTSFVTLLVTDDPTGLVVHVAARNAWVRCRNVPGALPPAILSKHGMPACAAQAPRARNPYARYCRRPRPRPNARAPWVGRAHW